MTTLVMSTSAIPLTAGRFGTPEISPYEVCRIVRAQALSEAKALAV